jgi:hypothetical protein
MTTHPQNFRLLTLLGLGASTFAFANTPILLNTDFSVLTGDDAEWIVGSNSFVGGAWQAFISDGYTLDDRVDPSGSGFIYKSWDDGTSDRLENFLFQEYGAGPLGSPTASVFAAGDVIVFKGSASATRVGNDPSDMIVRAFIKVLGYNDMGWAFQVKEEYSAFHNIGATLAPFELSVTFPDLTVDDSLQVLQVGFEITNAYDGSAMDSGTIYFENIEAYIAGTTEMWKGYEVLSDPDGWVNTGPENLGWIFMRNDPVLFSDSLQNWIFMAPDATFENPTGNWIYVFK